MHLQCCRANEDSTNTLYMLLVSGECTVFAAVLWREQLMFVHASASYFYVLTRTFVVVATCF